MNNFDFAKTNTSPLFISPRGAAWYAPENTLSGIMLAFDKGADAVEIDLHKTLDNRLVICHDTSTLRTTGTHLEISQTFCHSLRTLDAGSWFSERFKGEKVPLLEELLIQVPINRTLILDLKGDPSIVSTLVLILQRYQYSKPLYLMSSSIEILKSAYQNLPSIPRILKTQKEQQEFNHKSFSKFIKKAKDLKCKGVQISYSLISSSLIENLHKENLTVWSETIYKTKQAEKLIELGIDGINTNQEAKHRKALSRILTR